MIKKGRSKIRFNDVLKNEIRKKIMGAISITPLSITQLSEKLKINRGTLKHHLSILLRNNVLQLDKLKDVAGKPVMISLKVEENKIKEYRIELLKMLKKNKEMKQDDFLGLIPFDPENMDNEKYNAHLKLLWLSPKLVEQYIKITPEGEKFLKDNSKT